MKPYQSWGGYPVAAATQVHQLYWIPDRLPDTAGKKILAYGLGRSQGDSCLNDQGVLLDTSHLDRFIAVDYEQGIVTCEAGVTLEQILELCTPHGWFLPVVPGTKHVTVGGAIANDIHGKNHLTAGTFGQHVTSVTLLRSDGRHICSPTQKPELFAATIGGLGLTGLITSATIKLRRVPSPWLQTSVLPFQTISEGIALIQTHSVDHEYVIGQFDALPGSVGKGVLMLGDHAPVGDTTPPKNKSITVPIMAPHWLLNDLGMRAFNTLYYLRQAGQSDKRVHYQPYFFPLDSIGNWNRLYGARGFVQYQSVVPHAQASSVYTEILRLITKFRHGSYLASLKVFGTKQSPGLLSFPRPGIVIALDFPFKGDTTLKLLEQCDALVRAAGGAVYPAKDARMSATSFKTYYPRWREFAQHIDPAFSSSFWRRVMSSKIG